MWKWGQLKGQDHNTASFDNCEPALCSRLAHPKCKAVSAHLCVEQCVGGLAPVADWQQLLVISEGTRAQHEAGQLNVSSNSSRQHQALQQEENTTKQTEGCQHELAVDLGSRQGHCNTT